MPDETDIITDVRAFQQEADRERRETSATKIYHAIRQKLYSFIKYKVYPSERDDVMSATMYAIFTSLEKCNATTDDKFIAWCRGIANHKVIDQRRKRKPSQDLSTLPMDEIEGSVLASMEINPPSSGEKADLEKLMALLKRSKPECHDWLWMHFYDGIEVKELAALLRVKYDAMLRRIQRCLRRMKGLL